jgi:carboxypeptidase C (cathepsin A)
VFIDPIGTGYSRSLVDEAETKKAFYGNDPDIRYLSKVVFDWLVKEGRLRSPKYVMGESYGGYRAPRIAYELQSQIGVGVNGLVLVSPYLDPASGNDATALSPLPWMIDLPSMAAANLERQGKLTRRPWPRWKPIPVAISPATCCVAAPMWKRPTASSSASRN